MSILPRSEQWPNLFSLRRAVCPRLETLFPPVKFTMPIYEIEFAGVWEKPPAIVRDELDSMEDVYINNTAACKYLQGADGSKTYEVGSYAHRPDGRFGKYQTHFRLVPHDDGTAIYTHHEINALYNPIAHYLATEWNATRGTAVAQALLPLDGPEIDDEIPTQTKTMDDSKSPPTVTKSGSRKKKTLQGVAVTALAGGMTKLVESEFLGQLMLAISSGEYAVDPSASAYSGLILLAFGLGGFAYADHFENLTLDEDTAQQVTEIAESAGDALEE